MSIEWLKYARSTDGPNRPNPRFVLSILADHANHAGQAWPSLGTLRRETRLGESTIRRCIKALEADGYLSVIRGHAQRNSVYTLHRVSGESRSPRRVSQRDLSDERLRGTIESERVGISETAGGVRQTEPPDPLNGRTTKNHQQQQPPGRALSDADDAETISPIREALKKIGVLDRRAAISVLADCRRGTPNVAVDEIAFWIGYLGEDANRNPRIRDRKGYVIASVSRHIGTCDWKKLQMEVAAREAARVKQPEPPAEWPPQDQFALSLWRGILIDLEKIIIRQSFETWLKPTRGWDLNERTLYVRIPSPEFEHLGEKYSEQIETAIRTQRLPLDRVLFVSSPDEVRSEDSSA